MEHALATTAAPHPPNLSLLHQYPLAQIEQKPNVTRTAVHYDVDIIDTAAEQPGRRGEAWCLCFGACIFACNWYARMFGHCCLPPPRVHVPGACGCSVYACLPVHLQCMPPAACIQAQRTAAPFSPPALTCPGLQAEHPACLLLHPTAMCTLVTPVCVLPAPSSRSRAGRPLPAPQAGSCHHS